MTIVVKEVSFTSSSPLLTPKILTQYPLPTVSAKSEFDHANSAQHILNTNTWSQTFSSSAWIEMLFQEPCRSMGLGYHGLQGTFTMVF